MTFLKTKLAILLLVLAPACDGASDSGVRQTGAGTIVDMSSPAATLRTHHQASLKGDVDALKQVYSKRSLEIFRQSAEAANATLEDEILHGSSSPDLTDDFETQNEIVNGDAATVEKLNAATGVYDTIPLVREDARWKIARDKYMDQLLQDTPPPIAGDLQPPDDGTGGRSDGGGATNVNQGNSDDANVQTNVNR